MDHQHILKQGEEDNTTKKQNLKRKDPREIGSENSSDTENYSSMLCSNLDEHIRKGCNYRFGYCLFNLI